MAALPPSPRVLAALALVLAFAPLTACGSSGAATEAGPAAGLEDQKLAWKACAAPSEAEGGGSAPSPPPGGGTWTCATLQAPLDHTKPDGERIGIALIRAQATDKAHRIGSLVFNFGGPGGSGVATLPAFAKDYAKLRTRYDLVSFDPRGVGRSDGVRCEADDRLDAYYAQDSTPDTAAEEKSYADSLAGYAKACQRNSGKLLPHVGTTDAARDMELMRKVLGDDKFHYFGISYGTELGGVYAHLYPKSVGRAVFDGVVDPTAGALQGALGQAQGFQLALDNWAQDCVRRGDKCLLPGTTTAQVEANITTLVAGLGKTPIPGSGFRELTATAATNGIAQSLYSKEYWPLLEQGVDEAQGGNGALLLALSDSMNGRNPDGTYSNIQAANAAVNCADYKERYGVADVKRELPRFRAASKVFGDYLAWGLLGCHDWPVAGKWSHPEVGAAGSAPILVVGNTGDPATPYAGAHSMAQQLGEGVGVELTYKGQGHGAYDSGSKCVQNTVNSYLLEGKTPATGTVCAS
jgi:pimeloyl-ACP methyl ester carboxylesterase